MRKPPSRPIWWRNTFYWIAVALVGVALFGAIRGQAAIRDPGQTDENGLVWIYLGGAALMVVNGWLTHRIAVRQFEEATGDD